VSLVELIERLRGRPALALVAGVALEAAVMALIGVEPTIRDIRGIGGETGLLLAVIGAIAAGPLAGTLMALAGWAVFFPLIAHEAAASIIALPVWVGTALAVGALSEALLRSERARSRAELDAVAAHELRTPVAVIHGMAQTLRRQDLDDLERDKLLELIEHESDALLRRGPFRGDGPER
jgi:signal transduction histidine kinase